MPAAIADPRSAPLARFANYVASRGSLAARMLALRHFLFCHFFVLIVDPLELFAIRSFRDNSALIVEHKVDVMLLEHFNEALTLALVDDLNNSLRFLASDQE
jgi:hypothetical protein